MQPESVQVHSITADQTGWVVRVFQSPQPLSLSAEHARWAGTLESARQNRSSVWLAWDPDTGEILDVSS